MLVAANFFVSGTQCLRLDTKSLGYESAEILVFVIQGLYPLGHASLILQLIHMEIHELEKNRIEEAVTLFCRSSSY